MNIRILTILLIGFSALHCDLGQTPPAEPPEGIMQGPWIAGKITSASQYPTPPLSYAEVTISWGSGHSATLTDTSGKFRFQQVPRAFITFRATAPDCDTVSRSVDLIATDTASIEIALKMQKGFVPGQICVGLQDSTSLRTFVRFADSRGLTIKNAVGFPFVTDSISADSAQRIRSLLSGKPYLSGASFFITNGRLTVWYFRDVTSSLLQDWETTYHQLGFREVPSQGAKFAVLLVSPGTEHEWIRQLGGEHILMYICLNVIATISDPAAT